jgi:lysyl-tRNA synthetase class 2
MADQDPRNPKNPSNPQDATDAAAASDQEQDRRAKLAKIREQFAELDPYGQREPGLMSLATARERFDAAADEAHKADSSVDERPRVKVAGRVVLHRDIGKLVFATLRDATDDIQIAVSKKQVDQPSMALAKLADLGDIVACEGRLGTTKTGEITVWAAGDASFRLLTKSLAPAPGKWSGLQDPELRYRKRYVDLYANPEVLQTFAKRSRIIQRVREFLTDPPQQVAGETDGGFLEVETPMMQAIPGGAAARPFVTHHNALDIDLFLRIAPELYLKRLLVGGMPRVFEINRNFRNEGIDRSHNPEFTMLELYQAFGDYNTMMCITENLLQTLAEEIGGGRTLPYGEHQIDFSAPFRRAKYFDLFAEANGFAASDRDRVIEKAKQLHIESPESKAFEIVLNEVWEETVEPLLVQPTFVIDYPAAICPLTKRKVDQPEVAERFELFIANMEIANAYTELNDPDVQEANFRQQLAGVDDEESTFRTMDTEFIDALKVGMPPAGGLGIGIDRVVMLLTNQTSIRDVILFPLMRPSGGGK